MVVADGMGGHVGGRVASTISVNTFLATVGSLSEAWDVRLEAGLTAANEALRRETESQPDLHGMGSTLVGAVIGEHGLGWISIGDSALYLHQSGTLTRLNEDHSFGAYLDQQAREGLMTSEAARSDRRRNHLFYALLGDQLDHFERFSGFRALSPGDLVLLASDGLKTLDDSTLAAIIADHAAGSVEDLVADLLAAVETADRDRQDNVSVIAARIAPARPRLGATTRDAPTAPPLAVTPSAAGPRAATSPSIAVKPGLSPWLAGLAAVGLAVVGVLVLALGRSH